MRAVLLLAIALLSAAPLHAEDKPPKPADFAQGFQLDAPPGAAIYRVHLDESVYRATQRADLGDLAVFNASDDAVPQAFEPAQPAPPPSASEQSLAFYPLQGAQKESESGGLHLRLDAAGSVVSIDAPSATQVQSAGAWIVDTGGQHQSLRALRLQWAPTATALVLPLTLRASSDLQQWQPLTEATIAELEHGGHRLRQDTIEIHGAPARFLRLDAARSAAPIELQAVTGRVQGADRAEPLRRYTELAGHRAGGADAGWVFDARGPLPVDRLRVRLPGQNNLAELRVWSRARESDRWIDRGSVLAYRLEVGGANLESGESALTLTRERYWRLEPLTGDAGALGEEPVIELGWQPDALVFVARGAGPFTLAVGSATRIVRAQAVASLLGSLGSAQRTSVVGEAAIGAPRTLGGEAALTIPAPPVPWQRYLMWGVLIAGVVVLLRMALSLLRSA